jgi:hypothetical protein
VGKLGRTASSSCLRKSIRKRLLAKLKQVKDELRKRMRQPLADVGKWLRSVIQGYFSYHAVPGNFASLQRFRREVSKRWLRVLQRRSQKRPDVMEAPDRFRCTVASPAQNPTSASLPDLCFDAKYLR